MQTDRQTKRLIDLPTGTDRTGCMRFPADNVPADNGRLCSVDFRSKLAGPALCYCPRTDVTLRPPPPVSGRLSRGSRSMRGWAILSGDSTTVNANWVSECSGFNLELNNFSVVCRRRLLGAVRISAALLSGPASPRSLAGENQRGPSTSHIILAPGQPVTALTP